MLGLKTRCVSWCSLALAFAWTTALLPADEQLRVPAYTAYLNPDVDGARVSEKRGITDWTDPNLEILWFGQFRSPGALQASVTLQPPPGSPRRYRLTLGDQTRTATVTPPEPDRDGETSWARIDFGSFVIDQEGYHRLALSSDDPGGTDLQALLLQGPALEQAHFNMKPRRNAASVHLFYPTPTDARVSAFYCEMTGLEDPLWTYYMACGWHRGYFGMQVNSPTERRIIFSVWDSGQEAVDRGKVAREDRVALVAKGEDVIARDFGNEGTGGHSHLKYQWKTGERQRFLVTAEPVDAASTVYAGYYFHPERQAWTLISSWKAPKDGGYLRGLYSFSENFVGSNGHLRRKALYGNQWIRLADGSWKELTEAKFSHDATGKADRLDRFMGLEHGQFFLSHGGFEEGFTDYGTVMERAASGRSPEDSALPPLP